MGTLVDRIEIVDLEGSADLIARNVLEDVEHQQMMLAPSPGFARREHPSRLRAFDGYIACDRNVSPSHAERTHQQGMVEGPGKAHGEGVAISRGWWRLDAP